MINLMKLFGRGEQKMESERAKIVVLEPPVSEKDVRAFFLKLDAEEMNVPAAVVIEWKQMAVERMKTVKSAEEFAYEQGRLAAYCEMEKMFLETAQEMKTGSAHVAEEGEDGDA